MKNVISLMIAALAGVLAGCAASLPPPELVNARQAYERASVGQAAQVVPAELHKAQEALAVAEKSFQDDPTSFRTRDLAYIADRKAKMAEALATTSVENAAAATANKEYQATQADIVNNTKANLAASELSAAVVGGALVAEQKARLDAEKKAADAQADLATLAATKAETITLSGSVLFATNKSEILPAAQGRLNEVSDALLSKKDRNLTVEGFTDSRGSSSSNLELSQQRADVVRSYIVARGYPSDRIRARGIGEDRPAADNATAEGRATNRRVEIVVDSAVQTQ